MNKGLDQLDALSRRFAMRNLLTAAIARPHFIAYDIKALPALAPFIAQKRLKIVLDKFERPPRPIQVVYPHARLLPARTRAFIDWIRSDLTAFR